MALGAAEVPEVKASTAGSSGSGESAIGSISVAASRAKGTLPAGGLSPRAITVSIIGKARCSSAMTAPTS
jgi:hypothetical protein